MPNQLAIDFLQVFSLRMHDCNGAVVVDFPWNALRCEEDSFESIISEEVFVSIDNLKAMSNVIGGFFFGKTFECVSKSK
ncbi:hypothetical protein ABTF93_19760, partial [Acinetobacter baumannii]